MKKILNIIEFIVIGWLVATWVISSNIKGELENYITKTNNLYSNSGIKIKLTSFEKSLFSSAATVSMSSNDDLAKEILNFPIELKYDIEHGPIFFKDGFGFGIAKMYNEFSINSILKEKNVFKDNIVLTSDTIITFSKNILCNASTKKATIKSDDIEIVISPTTFVTNTSIDDFTGVFDALIPSIEIKGEKFSFKNSKFTGNTTKLIQNKLMLGDYKISTNIVNSGKENPFDILADVDISIKKDSETTVAMIFDIDVDLKDTILPKDMLDLKSGKIKYTLEGLSIEGLLMLDEVVTRLEKIQEDILNKSPIRQIADINQLETKMINTLVNLLNKILIKDKSSISYSFLATTKDNKTSCADIKVGYVGEKLSTDIKEMERKLLDILTLNFNINLDEEHIKAVPNAHMIEQQLQMVINQGFVKKENGAYKSNITYKPQTIMINGKDMTPQLLPFIKMMLQER